VADNNISKTFTTGDVDSNGKKVAFISMSIKEYNKKVAQKEFTAQSIVAFGACKINKQVVRKAVKGDEENAVKNFGTGDEKWNGGLVKHPEGKTVCDASCPDGQVRILNAGFAKIFQRRHCDEGRRLLMEKEGRDKCSVLGCDNKVPLGKSRKMCQKHMLLGLIGTAGYALRCAQITADEYSNFTTPYQVECANFIAEEGGPQTYGAKLHADACARITAGESNNFTTPYQVAKANFIADEPNNFTTPYQAAKASFIAEVGGPQTLNTQKRSWLIFCFDHTSLIFCRKPVLSTHKKEQNEPNDSLHAKSRDDGREGSALATGI
jgi:hypothetical protein